MISVSLASYSMIYKNKAYLYTPTELDNNDIIDVIHNPAHLDFLTQLHTVRRDSRHSLQNKSAKQKQLFVCTMPKLIIIYTHTAGH